MPHFTRRHFLQQTALATAAAGFLPTAQAADAPPQSKSPNERLSVAVIGVRGRGGDHAKAYDAREDCVVTHICDCDESVGQRAAARFKSKPKFVQDLRRIFDDKSIDIVSIATPNHWHALAAIWAMQAGKDVYVEKPVSHNVSEGRRIVQAARKYNRICQAGTQHRSNGANRAMAQFVRSGKLGPIKLAHVATYRPRTTIGPAGQYQPPETIDYNLWAGPAPMEQPVRRKSFHYDWHWFWDWGNGELGNNSIHAVDTMRLITGLTGLGTGVLSYGARVGLDDCAQTPSVQVTVHDFAGTTVVQEIRNLKTPGPKSGAMNIVGTEGRLGGLTVYDKAGKVMEKLTALPAVDHFDNFIQAVRTRRRQDQNAEIEEGHTSTSVVHVANISQRLGKPASPKEIQQALEATKLDPSILQDFADTQTHLADNNINIEKTPLTLGPWLKIDKEQFQDNPAATAMLTREYRKGFEVPSENDL